MSENILLEIQQSARHTLSQGPGSLAACADTEWQTALQQIQQHLPAGDSAQRLTALLTQVRSAPEMAAEVLSQLPQAELQQLIEAISACFEGKEQPVPVKKLELLDFDAPEDSPADAEAAVRTASDPSATPALKLMLNLAAAVYFVHHVSA